MDRSLRQSQFPGFIYIWRSWHSLQDSTDDNSIDKVETSLDWQEHFSQLQDTTGALPCHIHWDEVLPQDTTHFIRRPCYQRGSPCQDPAGNRTTQRPPDHHKEMQTVVVWSCLLFIRSGQNHRARHNERGKKTKQTEEEVWRQHQGMDRLGVRQVPEGSGEQRKKRKLVVKSSMVP